MLPNRVIGCQLLSLAWSPDLGIKVMMPLLIRAEVSPMLSMALNARSKVGAISFVSSWKNSVGMSSLPGALSFGIAVMVSQP